MLNQFLPRNSVTRAAMKIPRSIWIAGRRTYYRRSSSAPFLSGDLFADNSDLSVFDSRFRKPQPSMREMRDAKVVFCPSDRAEEFLENYAGSIFAKVIIFGNSDRNFERIDFKFPKSVVKVFLQNSSISNEMFVPLPIGLENIRLAKNGTTNLFQSKYSNVVKRNEILIGPFGRTHSERNFIEQIDPEMPDKWQVVNSRLSPRKYAELSSQYIYIAAPRGNGIDTHRFWETLYRGSIPIVKKSSWSASIAQLRIPFVEIEKWEEPDLLAVLGANQGPVFKPTNIPALWWPYWEETIASFC